MAMSKIMRVGSTAYVQISKPSALGEGVFDTQKRIPFCNYMPRRGTFESLVSLEEAPLVICTKIPIYARVSPIPSCCGISSLIHLICRYISLFSNYIFLLLHF